MALELPKAKAKMRTLADSDVIAHWRMEEASGTLVEDAAHISDLTNSSAADIVTGPFTGETNNRGRNFAAASFATGASTAGQRTDLLGEVTAEVWADLTSIAVNSTFVAHGNSGTDTTAANNTLLQFQVKVGGDVQLVWETGSGTNVIAVSPIPVTTGLHHIAARRRLVGATYDVDFFFDGVFVGTDVGNTAPSGGTSGSWALGNQVDAALGGGIVSGRVYEVRIASVALADEAIRESASRGLRDWDLTRVIASGHYTVHTRVLLRNGDLTWLDLTALYGVDFLEGFDDGDGVDDDGATGQLRLRRRSAALSVSPMMTTSRANALDPDGQFLDITRRIKIEEAVVPHGASASIIAGIHWQLVFDGYARAVGDAEGETLTIELRDRIYPLQVAWVQPDRTLSPDADFVYGVAATAIESVLAQQLTDWRPRTLGGTVEGYAGGVDSFALHTPVSPAFVIDNSPGGYSVPATSHVAQAQADLVDRTCGWLLRFTFDEVRQEFRYTLSDPGRGRTWSASDPLLEPWQYKIKKLDINDDDIRNEIEVEFGNSTDPDNATVSKRNSVRVEDALSVARYWRRAARIGLASTSELNTTAQATALANAVLSDLAYPVADFEVETLPRRDIRVGDLVKLRADGRRLGYDVVVAVVAKRDRRSSRDRRSTFVCRAAAPIGRTWRWMEMLDAVGITGGDGLKPPVTPLAPAVSALAGAARITWAFPANYGNKRYRETEVHVAGVSGFTPSSASLRDLTRGKGETAVDMDPTLIAYVKVIHRDEMGNVSAASPETAVTPRFLPKAPHVQAVRSGNQTIGSTSPDDIIWNSKQSGTDPFSQLNTSTGVFTHRKAGPLHIQARALYDGDNKVGAQGRLDLLVDVGGGYVTRRSGPVGTVAGSPARAQLELPHQVIWLPDGALVKIQIAQPTLGDPASAVIAGADTTWLEIVGGIHA